MVALVAPGLLVHPFARVSADRWDRKRLMMMSDMRSAISIWDVRGLWIYAIWPSCLGAIDAFFSPAESGMLREVVADQHMGQAMFIRTMIAQRTKIIGPSFSSVLDAGFGDRIGPTIRRSAPNPLRTVPTWCSRRGPFGR